MDSAWDKYYLNNLRNKNLSKDDCEYELLKKEFLEHKREERESDPNTLSNKIKSLKNNVVEHHKKNKQAKEQKKEEEKQRKAYELEQLELKKTFDKAYEEYEIAREKQFQESSKKAFDNYMEMYDSAMKEVGKVWEYVDENNFKVRVANTQNGPIKMTYITDDVITIEGNVVGRNEYDVGELEYINYTERYFPAFTSGYMTFKAGNFYNGFAMNEDGTFRVIDSEVKVDRTNRDKALYKAGKSIFENYEANYIKNNADKEQKLEE